MKKRRASWGCAKMTPPHTRRPDPAHRRQRDAVCGTYVAARAVAVQIIVTATAITTAPPRRSAVAETQTIALLQW